MGWPENYWWFGGGLGRFLVVVPLRDKSLFEPQYRLAFLEFVKEFSSKYSGSVWYVVCGYCCECSILYTYVQLFFSCVSECLSVVFSCHLSVVDPSTCDIKTSPAWSAVWSLWWSSLMGSSGSSLWFYAGPWDYWVVAGVVPHVLTWVEQNIRSPRGSWTITISPYVVIDLCGPDHLLSWIR